MTKEERIYQRIIKVFPNLQKMNVGDHRKVLNEPYMPLSLDILSDDPHGRIIALAHNSIMNGDVMADPDMQILVNFQLKQATAMTYQNSYVSVYQECLYFEDGKIMRKPSLQKELNVFLDLWTKNIIDQGFAQAHAEQEATHDE